MNHDSPPIEAPPQFTLRDLLLTVAVLAAVLAVLRMFSVYGAVLVWAAAVFFTVLVKRRRIGSRGEGLVDFVWGVAMPAVCLAFDPGFFHEAGGLPLEQPGHWSRPGAMLGGFGPLVYSAVAIQMATMCVWLIFGAALGRASGIVAGVFAIGFAIAVGVGLAILPLTIIGAAAIIGLLGTTPFLTAWVFGRQFTNSRRKARERNSRWALDLSLTVGAVFAIVLPFAVWWAVRTLAR